jgi:hypothetical protein
MIKKIILTMFVWLFFLSFTSAWDSCLLSDDLSKIKCEREIYLEQNISEIANSYEVNEVLWWTFYTTIIERLDDNQTVVNFEDWHIVIIAEVSFDEENNITEFKVIYPENYFEEKFVEEGKKKVSILKTFFLRILNFFKGILK